MLAFLFLFISFFQVGLLSYGSDAAAMAFIEHETIVLHHWLTPAQLADLMTFGRVLPGGPAMNVAAYTASAQSGAGAGVTLASGLVALAGLALPSFLWTWLIARFAHHRQVEELFPFIMELLRPLVPGLIIGAALLMARSDIFGAAAASPWQLGVSLFLFVATLVGTAVCRFNGGFMVLLCGLAGWLLL